MDTQYQIKKPYHNILTIDAFMYNCINNKLGENEFIINKAYEYYDRLFQICSTHTPYHIIGCGSYYYVIYITNKTNIYFISCNSDMYMKEPRFKVTNKINNILLTNKKCSLIHNHIFSGKNISKIMKEINKLLRKHDNINIEMN